MKYPKKSLTLHLYRYEEVLASLRWSIVKRNHMEAIFWGLELYDSDMMGDLSDVLVCAWVQHIGFGRSCFSVLADILRIDEMERGEFIDCLYAWCRLPTMDSTVFNMLLKGSLTPVEWFPRFPHSSVYGSLEQAVEDCLKRGKLMEAWLLGRAIEPEAQWFLLNRLAKSDRLKELDIIRRLDCDCLSRAAAFVLVSLTNETLANSLIPLTRPPLASEVARAIEEWDAEESIRKRRAYKIRPEAISLCERATLPVRTTTKGDIEIELEKSLKISHCWQEILSDYEEDGVWKSDQYKEMFYNTYFPWLKDDIPDEWSTHDKEQSHGYGFGKTEEVVLRQSINNMLNKMNKACIGLYQPIESVGVKLPPSLDWDSVYDNMLGRCSDSLKSSLPFKPIKKVFDLA